MVEQTPPKSETPSDISRTDGKVFERVFADGMKLVEETAAFLDGPGRELASALPREASLTYAAWSMELTTRLMQAASWLVMQRAVSDGDMDRTEALPSKFRIQREDPALDPAAQIGLGLPQPFLDLVDRAENLFERICRLDAALYASEADEIPRAVSDQLAQLRVAAETGAFDPLRVWGKAR